VNPLQETIVDLSEGNPGALSVLLQLVKAGRPDLIVVLRERGHRGSAIWTLYKDGNGEDLESLMMNLELLGLPE
jgi:hypothetical protein